MDMLWKAFFLGVVPCVALPALSFQAIGAEPIKTIALSFAPYRVAFSPAGDLIAIVGEDKATHLFDTETWKLKRVLEWKSEPTERRFAAVCFSKDGATLASGGTMGSVCVWSIKDGKEFRHWLLPVGSKIHDLLITSDGKTLVAATTHVHPRNLDYQGGLIRRWDIERGEELEALGQHEAPLEFAATLSNAEIFLASRDGMAQRWNLSKESGELLSAGAGDKYWGGWAISPDASEHAAACGSKIYLRSTAAGKVRATLEGHTDLIVRLCYSPSGKLLASTAADKSIRIWDTVSGKQLAVLKVPTDRELGLAFSPNGEYLVTAGFDKCLRIWRTVDFGQ
jgi:WD40 repeat protein